MNLEIMLNGEHRTLASGTTVEELVDQLGGDRGGDSSGRGIAVALNGVVVPHSAWTDTELADGARVEVVVAVQGG
ncbi:MAG: sulfur carrier protein ThiS [Solirubrobacteraceae bacterium]